MKTLSACNADPEKAYYILEENMGRDISGKAKCLCLHGKRYWQNHSEYDGFLKVFVIDEAGQSSGIGQQKAAGFSYSGAYP